MNKSSPINKLCWQRPPFRVWWRAKTSQEGPAKLGGGGIDGTGQRPDSDLDCGLDRFRERRPCCDHTGEIGVGSDRGDWFGGKARRILRRLLDEIVRFAEILGDGGVGSSPTLATSISEQITSGNDSERREPWISRRYGVLVIS